MYGVALPVFQACEMCYCLSCTGSSEQIYIVQDACAY